MVTRKSVAAKVATKTASTQRATKTTKPAAPLDGARRAPVAKRSGTGIAVVAGKTSTRVVEEAPATKTAKATKATKARAGAGAGAGAAAAAGPARKRAQPASPKEATPRTAGKVAPRASGKPGAKVARKVTSKPGVPAASGTASTRRVIAKRDGETRIVTPAIERIEGEIVEAKVAGVVPLPVAPGATRPAFWDQACADLMKRDRILKKLIPQFGPAHLTGRGEPFVTLARSIVGQQISVKAAQAVWDRVVAICPRLTPAQFIKAGHDALAGCGLSRRKAEYILDLATHFKSGALHVDAWASMDDEAVIAELTGIRGIGRWTAEMFLMFNLLRPDVLPLDDVGLINAISVNYFSGEPVTRSEAREVAANWEPWRSVATWYMWRSLEPVPVQY
ncbi:Fe-S cluster assembly protein HesB [Pandoraea nosoerga]|uniref:DNA-3-methyladenine glycosylase II n=1 Tax=Pandoraea nosoerga TaxID=2508296 RepID=A0A5E4TX87_9BURK|nr:DNA-3-methyladenine glycosylase [Pandoraea nosoerga]VVD91882.1 Fe-S cluster assembly protein HesB [Pandoraea nosoerga]